MAIQAMASAVPRQARARFRAFSGPALGRSTDRLIALSRQ
jgi:hypothetical protein